MHHCEHVYGLDTGSCNKVSPLAFDNRSEVHLPAAYISVVDASKVEL